MNLAIFSAHDHHVHRVVVIWIEGVEEGIQRSSRTKDVFPVKAINMKNSKIMRCDAYEVPPAGSTLSFGMQDSMSMNAKSRGRSKRLLSQDVSALALAMDCFHESSAPGGTVEFDAHPRHVISMVWSLVEIWCTVLLLSAPTRRTTPSLHAIARSCPWNELEMDHKAASWVGDNTIWLPSDLVDFQRAAFLRCAIDPLAI